MKQDSRLKQVLRRFTTNTTRQDKLIIYFTEPTDPKGPGPARTLRSFGNIERLALARVMW